MSQQVVISGVGVWHPKDSVTNEELVDSYNAYVDAFNEDNKAQIDAGEIAAMPYSSAEFIEKASGIKSRYIYQKEGALDIKRMKPKISPRGDDELSHQAEIAVEAAKLALASANLEAADIDAVIVSCAYTQRAYPAIAIEVQEALNIEGFGFDMLVACSAATFGMHRAYEMLCAKNASRVLVINPELVSPQINYTDRDSHFIFVYIHPYFDGNGRMGRFVMNLMMASGGYPWTIVPVERRDEYMQALEAASVNQDIVPFTKFLASLI